MPTPKKKIKELRICFMEKNGNISSGIYVFEKPNVWYPAVYFRKAKYVDRKTFETIIQLLRSKLI